MPTFLTKEQIDATNAEHALEIKKMLNHFLITHKDDLPPTTAPSPDAQERDQDYSTDRWGRVRVRDRIGDMLKMDTDEQRKVIPMADIMRSSDVQHSAVLKKPWFVHEISNRERVMAKHVLDNIDELLKGVPVRCRDFRLLAAQRLAIICTTTPMPVDTYTQCLITREAMQQLTPHRGRKQPFTVRYSIEAGALPTFNIATFCTGSGKTIMMVMALLRQLCCRDQWEEMKRKFPDILRSRTRETESGLCETDGTREPRLARLAIFYVPGNMLSHWYNTAESAVYGIKDVCGQHTEVVIWKKTGRGHNMKEAYEMGKPVLWILPMETKSLEAVRAHPHISYVARVYDELNMQAKPRYDQPESVPLMSVITQATIEMLERATDGAPKHPLRRALGSNFLPVAGVQHHMQTSHYSFVQEALRHFCKMRQFAAPEFLRRLVSEAVQDNMPSGLIVHKVSLSAGTLAAVATGSDMCKISLPDLAIRLLGSGVSAAVRDRVRHIFSTAEAASSAAILDDLDKEFNGMPLLNMADNTNKQAVARLQNRMTDMLTGKLPDCPITMEPIAQENVCVLTCCTAILDKRSVPGCNGKCPLCRAPLTQVGQMASPAEVEALRKRKAEIDEERETKKRKLSFQSKLPVIAKPKPEVAEALQHLVPSDSESDDESHPTNEGGESRPFGSVEELEQRIAAISADMPYSVDGILQVLHAQVDFQPSSRILLCFAFDQRRGEESAVINSITSRITREIDGTVVTDIEKLSHSPDRMEAAKQKYDDPVRFPAPHVFIINTQESSSSVQGLDLWMTDLTIVADQCALATQRQAIGRVLRMRRRPDGMKPGALFPAKRVVVAAIDGTTRRARRPRAAGPSHEGVAGSSNEYAAGPSNEFVEPGGFGEALVSGGDSGSSDSDD